MARSPISDPLITYGVGLTRTGNEVNLKPAKFDPLDLGGMYILTVSGIGITEDGGLSGIHATPDLMGMLRDAPYDGNGYIRKDGDWAEVVAPDIANIPIAGYTPPELGAVYIVPDRALRIEPDGALDVLPAAPDQLGVIFDPPFDSGNPDVTYVRKWGQWIASTADLTWGLGLYEDPNTPNRIHLEVAGNTPSQLGGVYTVPGMGIAVSSDGGLSAIPTTPTQYGVIQDAPFSDATNPISYVRQNATWVETTSSGITIADAPPPGATHGDTWWDSDSGKYYVYYTDVDTSQWVQISGGGGGTYNITGVEEAPVDTKSYARKDAGWTEVTVTGGGIGEAPNDGQAYARQSLNWSVVPAGTFVDAPADTKLYGRKDLAWSEVVVPPSIPIVPVADTFPASPVQGQLHFLGTDASLYIWFVDASSVGSWVEVSAP